MSTATAEQTILDAVKPQLFIGGEWRDAFKGGTLEVEDPATGEALTEIADATVDDALAALTAAHEAQAGVGGHPRRGSAARSCARRGRSSWTASTSSPCS